MRTISWAPPLLHDELIVLRSYRRDHMCSSVSGQSHRAQSDSSRSTLHQDRASFDGPRDMDSAMGGDAGNAEARALFERNFRRKWCGVSRRDYGILRCRPERPVALSAEAPYPLTDTRSWNTFTHQIDDARTIAVGYHPRESHLHAEGILALLDVAGINARCGNADAYLAPLRLWIRNLPDNHHFFRGALFLVPSCLHIDAPFSPNLYHKLSIKP